jgi:uncharacterized membrane protein
MSVQRDPSDRDQERAGSFWPTRGSSRKVIGNTPMAASESGNGGSRRTVVSYAAYPDAVRAVDHLSDRGFPVDRLAIVGHGLRLVERVIGRLGYRQAALNGAVSGAAIGALFGLLFGILDWIDPLISGVVLAFYGLVFGSLLGALIGLALHAATGGRRDFASVGGIEAERYDVVVDKEVVEEARRLLGELEPAGRPVR